MSIDHQVPSNYRRLPVHFVVDPSIHQSIESMDSSDPWCLMMKWTCLQCAALLWHRNFAYKNIQIIKKKRKHAPWRNISCGSYLLFATSTTNPVMSCPCFTKIGFISRQRTWYQCVSGSDGAVDSHTCWSVPLNSTSNQNAKPWHVPDSRIWNSSGIAIRRLLGANSVNMHMYTYWFCANPFRGRP